MADPHPTRSRKVTLEQLIQLKRAERPPAAFWESFDQELHRRQLAALVTVEPWHRRLRRAAGVLARRAGAIGAGVTAVACTVLALLRLDTAPRHDTPATIDHESKVVLLPEEAILVSHAAAPAPRVHLAAEEFHGNVHSAPQELGSGLASARRFVAVSAPVTIASESDTSAIYSARALTAGAVLRTLASAAPESL